MNKTPLIDDWGDVVNHPDTYAAVAEHLLEVRSLLVGWTDGRGTHHDLLFVLRPWRIGNIHRGLQDSGGLLFVSVIGKTTFGFDCIERSNYLQPEYVGEKLHIEPTGPTAYAVTKLISGVIEALLP